MDTVQKEFGELALGRINYVGMVNAGYEIIGQLPCHTEDGIIYNDTMLVIGRSVKGSEAGTNWVVWSTHPTVNRGCFSGSYCNTWEQVSKALGRRGGFITPPKGGE